MNQGLKISEAASLALHAMVILARDPERQVAIRRIAEELDASEAHLSKILQRLAKDGFVKAVRGPKGGFILAKPGTEITLLQIFEAIDGLFQPFECMFDKRMCDGSHCVFGGLLPEMSSRLRAI